MHEYNTWLGSLGSYELVSRAAAQEHTPKSMAWRPDPEVSANQYRHRLLAVQDGVGIINVKGSLVSGSSGWMIMYGVVGYDDIREALAAAVYNPDVGSIMLNIDSGGGAVAGVHETAQLVKRIDKVKPVYAYTGANMLSAALWFGAGARKRFISQTAEAGSLGILMVHKDYSQQAEKEGVKITVIRAGEHKAIGNPYEPLTDAAKKAMEKRAQTTYDIFLAWVASNTGHSSAVADKQYGQGVVLVGKDAVDAGLMTDLGSFEDAFSAANRMAQTRLKKKGGSNARMGATNNGTTSMSADATAADAGNNSTTAKETAMPQPYTEEQLAAMAAGVTLESEQELTPEQKAAAEAAQKQADADKAADKAKVESQAAAPAAEDKDVKISTLQTMLAQALSEKAAAAKQATDLQAKLDESAKQAAGFIAIARNGLKTMGKTLGVTAEQVDAMSADALLAEHARVSEQFKTKFKAGGVSGAAPKDTDKDKKAAAALPLFFDVATQHSKQ